MSEEENHIIPLKYIIRTFLTLLVLTGATVVFAMVDFSFLNQFLPRNMDLGPLNILIALGIATLKVAFVLGFFMGIAYDKHLNKAIVLMNFVFVTALFGLVLSDTLFRDVADPMEGKKIPFDSPVIRANQPQEGSEEIPPEPEAEEKAAPAEEEEEFVEEASEMVMEVDSSKLGEQDTSAAADTTKMQ